MGRPKKKIDEEKVAELAADGASNRDIAAILGINEITVRRRFVAILTKQRAERRMKRRRQQDALAAKGNPAMLIWLGKQELGQIDKQTTVHKQAEDSTKRLTPPNHDDRYTHPEPEPSAD